MIPHDPISTVLNFAPKLPLQPIASTTGSLASVHKFDFCHRLFIILLTNLLLICENAVEIILVVLTQLTINCHKRLCEPHSLDACRIRKDFLPFNSVILHSLHLFLSDFDHFVQTTLTSGYSGTPNSKTYIEFRAISYSREETVSNPKAKRSALQNK